MTDLHPDRDQIAAPPPPPSAPERATADEDAYRTLAPLIEWISWQAE